MSISQARSNMMKALMVVVLALAAAFTAGTLFVQSAHADEVGKLAVTTQEELKTPIEGNGFTGTAYGDGESLGFEKYSGSSQQVIVPVSVKSKDGKTTFNAGGQAWWFVDGAAFSDTKNKITGIAFPNGIKAVGSDALKGSTSVTEVAIGDSVEGLGAGAFSDCPNLKTYYVSGDNMSQDGYWGLSNNPGIGQYSDGKVIPGVTVYTKKGSAIDTYIQAVNKKSKESGNGNQINLVYENDPYSKNTIDTGNNNNNGNNGSNTPADRTKQMGEDGGPFSAGASLEALDAAIANYGSEADVKGSTFGLLQAKAGKLTKKSVKLTWKRAKGATKFIVYGNACGKKNKMVKLQDTTKTNINFKKVNGKAVKKGTYYKFIVVALDANNNVVATSKTVHAATPGGKKGNDKKVTTAAKKNKASVKFKKTFKLKGKAVAGSLPVSRHRKVAYESDNPAIATVTAKGIVKGVAKGKCNIYAYAQNGVFVKVKVTVK